MQRTKDAFYGPAWPLRSDLLRWLRTAAWVAAAGAATPTALAQAPADPGTTEQPAPSAEPADAAQPNAASEAASEPASAWNRRRTAPVGVDGQLSRLAADLKLDAGQQAKIRPILVAQREQMQRLQRDTPPAPAERQQRILALGDRTADQIRAQLTDAQRAQYIQPRAAPVVAQAPSSAKRSAAAASNPGANPARK